MNDRTDERIDELIALAALGELTESDEIELDALLSEDVDLVGEVDDAVHTAALLQQAVAEAPPAHLRASVLDAIATTPQITGDGGAGLLSDGIGSADEPEVAEPVLAEPSVGAAVVDLNARRRNRWVPALSAAAAMIMLAGIGIVVVGGDSGSDGDRLAQVENVVGSDDAVARELEGTLAGNVTVVYSPGEEAIVIDASGLPVLGDDRAFVLWFVDDDGATPVQIFQPDASGDVLVRVDDVDPTDFVLGITEEDADGAETPTLPILASA
ncbi:MAG: anti-sigma factor [Ilumatobacter sp.]|uniref:anti-sigma factor n=1 Tax=Ilumatobacter sp. TaxID=1967498 RepID=UPI0032970E85